MSNFDPFDDSAHAPSSEDVDTWYDGLQSGNGKTEPLTVEQQLIDLQMRIDSGEISEKDAQIHANQILEG